MEDEDLARHHHLDHPVEADLLPQVQEVGQEDGAHRAPAHLVPSLRPAQALLQQRVETRRGLLQRDKVMIVRDLVSVAHGAYGAVDVFGEHIRIHSDELQHFRPPEAVAAAEHRVVVHELARAVLDAVAHLELRRDHLVQEGLAVLRVNLRAALHDVRAALDVAPRALERARHRDVVRVEEPHELALDGGQHGVDVVALGRGAHHLDGGELGPRLLQGLDVVLHGQDLGRVVGQNHLHLAVVVHRPELRERVHNDVRLVRQVGYDNRRGGWIHNIARVRRGPVQAERVEVVLKRNTPLHELPRVAEHKPAPDDRVGGIDYVSLVEEDVDHDGRDAQDEPADVQYVERGVRGSAHLLTQRSVLLRQIRGHPKRRAGQGALPPGKARTLIVVIFIQEGFLHSRVLHFKLSSRQLGSVPW
mmetsp:Transcript_2667/g.4497  ORF Transcript_2667/g.4497 Transcript_2667/m.4497 type:complete len:417 (+) Transcript_2667:1235-2485(+)